MVNSAYFYKSWIPKLQKYIKELLYFIRVDLNLSIYPKLHFLVHYSDQIKLLGAIKLYSTDVFESTHKIFKSHLIPSANHKNIVKTMFEGVSLLYSYKLQHQEEFNESSHSKFSTEKASEHLPRDLLHDFEEFIDIYQSISFGTFKFKSGLYIPAEKSQTCTFLKIKTVFCSNNITYLLVHEEIFENFEGFYYRLVDSKPKNQKIIKAYDVWYRPVEIYNSSILLPSCYYFE